MSYVMSYTSPTLEIKLQSYLMDDLNFRINDDWIKT